MTQAQRQQIEAAHARAVRAMAAAGLPLVEITTEDRLRGAVISAIEQLERGLIKAAYDTLVEASRLA